MTLPAGRARLEVDMRMLRGLLAVGLLTLMPRLPASPAVSGKACCCKQAGHCAPGASCCARRAASGVPATENRASEAPAMPDLSCCQTMPCTAPEPGPALAEAPAGWHEAVRGPLADPSLAADPFKVPIA